MTEKELIDEIREYCLLHADQKIVKKYSHYFKEGYDAYGLVFGLITEKSAEILSRNTLTMATVLSAGNTLFRSGKYEEGSFAIWLLKGFKKQFSFSTFQGIGKWFENGISNWAHTDGICSELLSVLIRGKNIVPRDFSGWIISPLKFKRRAVPVSLLKLLNSEADLQDLFNLIEPLMTDNERVVQQGTGWFLREAWKRKPEATEQFLMKWKDLSPRLIFQYATEKMAKEHKEIFRKSKN
jgi:3-methyladenine DNA glycosylase AlkD